MSVMYNNGFGCCLLANVQKSLLSNFKTGMRTTNIGIYYTPIVLTLTTLTTYAQIAKQLCKIHDHVLCRRQDTYLALFKIHTVAKFQILKLQAAIFFSCRKIELLQNLKMIASKVCGMGASCTYAIRRVEIFSSACQIVLDCFAKTFQVERRRQYLSLVFEIKAVLARPGLSCLKFMAA